MFSRQQKAQFHLGIVAEDALYAILHLLKNNASNQHLFRENSHIPSLVPILNVLARNKRQEDPESSGDVTWSSQRISNLHLLFQVCSFFGHFGLSK